MRQVSNNLREFNSDLRAKSLGFSAKYNFNRRQYVIRDASGDLMVRKYNFETIMDWFEDYTSNLTIRLAA